MSNLTEKTDESFSADADAARWMAAIARSTTSVPANLDALLEQHNVLAQSKRGRVFVANRAIVHGAYRREHPGRPAIGWLATEERIGDAKELCATVTQLASLAVERDCEVIVISDRDIAGLERFGFRAERLCGDTEEEREVCLGEIRDFWQCDVIL